MSTKFTKITSAKKALKESIALESVWSNETRLTQRILIYAVELLEQIVDSNKRPKKKPRKVTPWNLHVAKILRAGGTIKEAAEQWKKKKG